ncbi:hypothetical protein [Chloroflexus islandicus]|nr:hypothetical protein [Chloroflexus islandicus]
MDKNNTDVPLGAIRPLAHAALRDVPLPDADGKNRCDQAYQASVL